MLYVVGAWLGVVIAFLLDARIGSFALAVFMGFVFGRFTAWLDSQETKHDRYF